MGQMTNDKLMDKIKQDATRLYQYCQKLAK